MKNHVSANSLKKLIGSEVQLNFGGPEKGKGILRAAKTDYCVIECKDGLYYYQMQHVKSFSTSKKDQSNDYSSYPHYAAIMAARGWRVPGWGTDNTEQAEDTHTEASDTADENDDSNNQDNAKQPLIPGMMFGHVLDRMKGMHIQINRGGPQKMKGIVQGRTQDDLILLCGKELVYVSLFHIKCIKLDDKKDKQQENSGNSQNNNGNKNEQQNNNNNKDQDKNEDQDKNKDQDKGKEKNKGDEN